MPFVLPKSIPRRVFLACMVLTATGIAVALAFTITSGWVPPRDSAAFALPAYFALLLFVLSVSFVASGDTLMHHHATGTIQRATSPVEFWAVVGVQTVVAIVLFVIAIVRWRALHGSAT